MSTISKYDIPIHLSVPNLLDQITIDDEVCNGRPTIRGYRPMLLLANTTAFGDI